MSTPRVIGLCIYCQLELYADGPVHALEAGFAHVACQRHHERKARR